MTALARSGITWVQEAASRPSEARVYAALARRGELTTRTNVAFRAEPGRWSGDRSRFGECRAELAADEAVRDHLEARTVKFFADGVIEMGTGFLVEPYTDTPHTCGLPNWSAAELAEAVTAFDEDGFQIHIHAIGDGGVRMALDAIEEAAARNGSSDRRAVIAHTQLVQPSDRAPVRDARSDRELRATVGVSRSDHGRAHHPEARPGAIRVAVPDRQHRELRCPHQLRQRLAGVVDAPAARPRGRQ